MKKVYCEDCGYFNKWDDGLYMAGTDCLLNRENPKDKNKNNDCPDFKIKTVSTVIGNFFKTLFD